MKLFDGIVRTHKKQGGFYLALYATISDLEEQFPVRVTGRVDWVTVRRIATERDVPVGGDLDRDPINAAVHAGRHFKDDPARVITAFQNAWEHYQTVCQTEGRMAA